ncbi:myb-like dna-binding shaqkyf class family protein [Stylonychia lemnae]|uniref:Myb-like dna-binding shaqkyf class family protein n=1 Tax=Stylonychia lemnae TaxID=5949 RepID=A0A078AUF0_STYLE|nr:myb-like dna-binding shaqkyf class family protein [Stylonychia lemnae]|eukprot:CDW84488.1 myb-like dna-binding shaqkyf class family protein [Stylonychia lemnae]
MIQNKSNNYSQAGNQQEEHNFSSYHAETVEQNYQFFGGMNNREDITIQHQLDNDNQYQLQQNELDLLGDRKSVQVKPTNQLLNQNELIYGNQPINDLGNNEAFQNHEFNSNSLLESNSPKSDQSELLADVHARKNNIGALRNVYSNDKSTAANSVTSTPPLQAARAPSDKNEDTLNNNNKSLSIRVPQDLGENNDSQLAYGQSIQSQNGKRGRKQTAQSNQSKSQRENESRAKQGNDLRQGRWSKEEHFRFLEALKLYGKEWRKVQLHVRTRTSTQARSHAQKFFVKIERKQIVFEDFIESLDINNLEKDMLFSDLDDDDEEPIKKSSSNAVRKESGRSLNDSENSIPKQPKNQRKKSVMNHGLIGSDQEENIVSGGSPRKLTNNFAQQNKFAEGAYELESQKSDNKNDGGSPTRTIHMRQSKSNHSILQKRYREDDGGQSSISIAIPTQNHYSHTINQEIEVKVEAINQIEPSNVMEQHQQNLIERKGNKRRVVENSIQKQGQFLEPVGIVPSLTKFQSMQPQTQSKQQPLIPLTPNLKHSDPLNIRLYEDKHIFKRSNSQNEFDFLTQNSVGLNFLDFNDNSHMPHLNPCNIDNDFFGLQHETIQLEPSAMHQPFDKPFSTPFPPFANLSASALPTTMGISYQQQLGGANGHFLGNTPCMNQINQFIGRSYGNSFDLFDGGDHQEKLMDMNGDSYQRMIGQRSGFDSPTPNYLSNPKSTLPNFNPNQFGNFNDGK